MIETTTIRVEKPVVDWLNSLKGFLDYTLGLKLTLNDALRIILGEVDVLFAERQGIIKPNNAEARLRLVNRRVDQFWGIDNEDKPDFAIGSPEDILLEEQRKGRKHGKN